MSQKRKCVQSKTQVRLTWNARTFDLKRKCVLNWTQGRFERQEKRPFREEKKTNLDGLSGLAGIFIKYIYAGCGTSLKSYSTPVYRKFEKPVPTPTTRQAFRCRFMLLCWFNVCKSGKYGFFFHSSLLLLEIFVWRHFHTLFRAGFTSVCICISLWKNALTFWFKCTCVLV